MNPSPTPTVTAERGPWRRWLDFWFAPGDPTTMGFIRIVTGCLVLYVHLAYCFDLQNFFGKDGWYGLEYVNRERRDLPHVVGSLDWDLGPYTAQVPEFPHRKKAVLAYIRNLSETRTSRAEMDRSLAFFTRLQQANDNNVVQAGLGYLVQLSLDETDRRNQLAVLADESERDKRANTRVPQLKIPETPLIAQSMSAQDRKTFAEEAEAFFRTLPQGAKEEDFYARGYILSHLSELPHQFRGSFLQFLKELPTLSAEERDRRIDYLEYWNYEERYAYRKGNPIFSIWFHITDPTSMAIAHAVVLVILFLFTVGYCTRVTSVLAWLAAISYIHRTQQVLFGMDTMTNILLFYLMIGNSGAAMSIDRVISRYRAVRASLQRSGTVDAVTLQYLDRPPLSVAAGFSQRLLQVHFCFIYMAAGLSKLKGGAWWNTNAYWDTLVNPEFTLIHFQWYEALIRYMVSDRLTYALAAAFGVGVTFIAEICLPFLVWTRLRPYIVMFGFALHAGVAVFMGLWIFSLLMMMMLVGYLPGTAIRERLFGSTPKGDRSLLKFNPNSASQCRAAALVQALDFENGTELKPDTADANSVRIVVKGQESAGPEAVSSIFANVSWLRPLRLFMLIPGLSSVIQNKFSGTEKAK